MYQEISFREKDTVKLEKIVREDMSMTDTSRTTAEDKRFVVADGTNSEFVALCKCLDQELDQMVGKVIQREKYEKYNQLDRIYDVIIVYDQGKAIGSGGYRFYNDETVELKRIYLAPEYRSQGIGRELLQRLEARAKIQGYTYAILETGDLLKDAMRLYTKAGYEVIPNYGPYVDMSESICMSKKL